MVELNIFQTKRLQTISLWNEKVGAVRLAVDGCKQVTVAFKDGLQDIYH